MGVLRSGCARQAVTGHERWANATGFPVACMGRGNAGVAITYSRPTMRAASPAATISLGAFAAERSPLLSSRGTRRRVRSEEHSTGRSSSSLGLSSSKSKRGAAVVGRPSSDALGLSSSKSRRGAAEHGTTDVVTKSPVASRMPCGDDVGARMRDTTYAGSHPSG